VPVETGTSIQIEITEPTDTIGTSKGNQSFCGTKIMEVLEINSDGSETRLDLASADSSLSLEGTVLKFAHKAVGAWSYAIRYSLQ